MALISDDDFPPLLPAHSPKHDPPPLILSVPAAQINSPLPVETGRVELCPGSG